MKENEARDLVTMLAAAVSYRLTPDEKTVWEEQFRPLDADLAYKTVMAGREYWKFFPSWLEFKDVYRSQKRLAEPVGEQRADLPEPKRGVIAPGWVHIWYFCRNLRDPREWASFPQQDGNVDPATIMSSERFDELREEWEAAGSPKAKINALM